MRHFEKTTIHNIARVEVKGDQLDDGRTMLQRICLYDRSGALVKELVAFPDSLAGLVTKIDKEPDVS